MEVIFGRWLGLTSLGASSCIDIISLLISEKINIRKSLCII